MTKRLLILAIAVAGVCGLMARAEEAPQPRPTATIKTSEGTITLELWPDVAPATVTNFQKYADSGFYEGTIFHRVISGFMVQGGGFSKNLRQKAPRSPIKNEASPEALNKRGTIAMGRTMAVDSATSQFYINHADNPPLDQRDTSPGGFGYCVFGQVTDGMAVVDAIAAIPTMSLGMFQNLPRRPVTIEAVTVEAVTVEAAPAPPSPLDPPAVGDPSPASSPDPSVAPSNAVVGSEAVSL
jgi:cyclophilin family peptidyl-prolyl cis-trans isomerase